MNEENTFVNSRMDDEYQVISLNGSVTYDVISEYKRLISESICEAKGYMIDLTNVKRIDSTGLGLLVNTAKYFISNRNKMVIINTDSLLQELFEVSKLHMVFEIHKSKSDALKALSVPDEEYWSKVSLY